MPAHEHDDHAIVRNHAHGGDRAARATGRCRSVCVGLFAALAFSSAAAAAAKPHGEEAWMIRMLSCEGPDAKMEVYLPQRVAVFGGHTMQAGQTAIGYYALDLTSANKGKSLEPVRVTLSADKKSLIVDQYTRGLPATRIPVAGGTVDFDQRFATAAKCGPFRAQDPDYGN